MENDIDNITERGHFCFMTSNFVEGYPILIALHVSNLVVYFWHVDDGNALPELCVCHKMKSWELLSEGIMGFKGGESGMGGESRVPWVCRAVTQPAHSA